LESVASLSLIIGVYGRALLYSLRTDLLKLSSIIVVYRKVCHVLIEFPDITYKKDEQENNVYSNDEKGRSRRVDKHYVGHHG
jgi:hypothetical protein